MTGQVTGNDARLQNVINVLLCAGNIRQLLDVSKDKGRKAINKTMKENKGPSHERNHSSLNFSGLYSTSIFLVWRAGELQISYLNNS
jgi:hypothetical protein